MFNKDFSNKLINTFYKKKIKLIIKKNKLLFIKFLFNNKNFNLISFDRYLNKIYKSKKSSRIKKKFFLNLKKLVFF